MTHGDVQNEKDACMLGVNEIQCISIMNGGLYAYYYNGPRSRG